MFFRDFQMRSGGKGLASWGKLRLNAGRIFISNSAMPSSVQTP
jgi:hypothetical protein